MTLRKLFPMPSAGTVAYDFSVYPRQYDEAGANSVLGALQISDGAGDLYELQLDVRDSTGGMVVIFAEYAGFVDGGSSYVAHPVTGLLAVEAWTQVSIELDIAQPAVARVYFDGVLQIETTVDIPIQGTAIQISCGLSYVSAPSDTWVANYDNVAFRLL